jgi:hypothetical protein
VTGEPERPAGRTTDHIRAVPRPVIADEIVVAEFKKNRTGDSARIVLRTYEGTNIIDIRTWHGGGDGYRRPGKGFACAVTRLPELAKALAKAELTARDLGLLEAEGEP